MFMFTDICLLQTNYLENIVVLFRCYSFPYRMNKKLLITITKNVIEVLRISLRRNIISYTMEYYPYLVFRMTNWLAIYYIYLFYIIILFINILFFLALLFCGNIKLIFSTLNHLRLYLRRCLSLCHYMVVGQEYNNQGRV